MSVQYKASILGKPVHLTYNGYRVMTFYRINSDKYLDINYSIHFNQIMQIGNTDTVQVCLWGLGKFIIYTINNEVLKSEICDNIDFIDVIREYYQNYFSMKFGIVLELNYMPLETISIPSDLVKYTKDNNFIIRVMNKSSVYSTYFIDNNRNIYLSNKVKFRYNNTVDYIEYFNNNNIYWFDLKNQNYILTTDATSVHICSIGSNELIKVYGGNFLNTNYFSDDINNKTIILDLYGKVLKIIPNKIVNS